MANKTEKPTRKRKEEAAKKGQSFKSKDLIVACLTLGGGAYLVSFASLKDFMDVFGLAVSFNDQESVTDYAKIVFGVGLKFIIPFIALCFVFSTLPSVLQTGFVLATKALKLQLSALNPAQGFKKMFSLRTIKDTVKTLLYLGVFVVAVIIFWHENKVLLFSQIYGDLFIIAGIWRDFLFSLIAICLAGSLSIFLLDAVAEYFLVIKEMKMDKEEVKREMKETEGNPEIKFRRREVHMEILSEQIKSDVSSSSLIIANPTHIAIGVYLNPELMPFPLISVYETNQRALAVRKYAEEVGVPVVVDIKLARRIFKTHRRYDFVSLDEIDEILRLLVWLAQVEKAGESTSPDEENMAGTTLKDIE